MGALMGGLVSGGLGLMGQDMANSANAKMAADQMAFQERMSNTSYQRGVKDLQRAGLNQMLAYGHLGASTPEGSSAVMQNALGPAATSAVDTYQKHQAVESAKSQQDNINADTANKIKTNALTDAQIEQTKANTVSALEGAKKIATDTAINNDIISTGKIGAETQNLIANSNKASADVVNLSADTVKKQAETSVFPSMIQHNVATSNLSNASAKEANARTNKVPAEISNISADTKQKQTNTRLSYLEIPRATNDATKSTTWWGKHVSPYLGDIGATATGAFAAKKLIKH